MTRPGTTNVTLTFDSDKHPIISEWYRIKLDSRLHLINKVHGAPMAWLTIKEDGTGLIIGFTTEQLNCEYVYANILGFIDSLNAEVEQYFNVHVKQCNTRVKKARFVTTQDFGSVIDTEAEIELRRVGNRLAKHYPGVDGKPLADIFVIGEPTACRKMVGKIRHMMRDGINWQFNNSLKWLESVITGELDNQVMVYAKQDTYPWGRLLRQHDTDLIERRNHDVMNYINMCRDGKLKDIFGLQSLIENDADVYGVIELCLKCMKFSNRVTAQNIQTFMALVEEPK